MLAPLSQQAAAAASKAKAGDAAAGSRLGRGVPTSPGGRGCAAAAAPGTSRGVPASARPLPLYRPSKQLQVRSGARKGLPVSGGRLAWRQPRGSRAAPCPRGLTMATFAPRHPQKAQGRLSRPRCKKPPPRPPQTPRAVQAPEAPPVARPPVAAAPPAADAPPLIRYRFVVPVYQTAIGQYLKVVGSLPGLGAWVADKAPPMVWKEGHKWVLEVDAEPGTFEFKVRAGRFAAAAGGPSAER